MWKRRKYTHPGASMEGRTMFLAPVEQQRDGDACYQDTYSNYRLEMPERKQNRKGRLGTKLMRMRFVLPRVRIRILSPMHLFEKMRDSYWRLVFAHRKPDQAAVSPFYQYKQDTYSSDAIAECIEFVKKSSVNQESALLEKVT